MKDISLIAFDADDTLWECQTYFEAVEKEYCEVLKPYASADEVSKALFAVETANMPLLGYGSKAFLLSLLENAIEVSEGKLKAKEVKKIIDLGKGLLELPGRPMDGVEETLKVLHDTGKYHLVVFTKGELLDQENKFHRSGLSPYFDNIIVVSDKTEKSYHQLCDRYSIDVDQLLMVGNSFRSDIEPVLKLGGWAAHIPFHTVWQHEVVEEYDHPHLLKLEFFTQLKHVLLNGFVNCW
ncbi:HAD family hydrolase [Prevotella melaninogenica]|uniref:Haloacid dehalogenase n=1 Tax=Prevotella melaninogenica TaxID=28132 RepID=A0A250KGW1_9BACT|nr:HAD family hydrolase [Prevotella melaninogenica]BBA28871.1 haloacid dehalogenase [Prevotella melaninogenica]